MVQLLVLLANLLCKSLPKKNNKFYTLVNSTKLELALTKIYIRKYCTTDVSLKKTNTKIEFVIQNLSFSLLSSFFYIYIYTLYIYI